MIMGLILGLIAMHTSAASSAVVSGDWISNSGKTLLQCSDENCNHESCYAYSFVVVGDTQNLNIADVRDVNVSYMATLYNWILSNKESKNIQYVLGLGDITQAYHRGYSSGIWIDEWNNAAEAVSLLDGKLGYSLVRGNHDISDAKDGFNGIFGAGDKIVNGVDNQYYEDLLALSLTKDSFGRPMAGFRTNDKIEDSYRKIEIGSNKYIIFTLDWHPTKAGDASLKAGEVDCLSWIDNVLSENSDYKAIITLHSFIWYDGSITDDVEDVFPYENLGDRYDTWGEVSEVGGNSTPDELWNVLKTHSNVEMILCGHVDSDYIVTTQLRGDNGNTVTCMLVDGQTIDSTVEPVGLVAVFYVKADGSVMNVEYISTVRAAAGKPSYLRENNQFEVTLDYEDQWVCKSNTYIPTSIYNAYPFHVTLDDDSNPETTNTLFGSYASWQEALAGMHAFNGISNIASRKEKTWNIVMSRDYTFAGADLGSYNKAGNCPGKTVVNLNGYTLTVGSGATLLPIYNSSTSYHSKFAFEDGKVVLQGTGKIIVTQHGHVNATGGSIDINLTNVSFSYSSSANGSIVSYYGGAAGGPSKVNLYMTDCTVDASLAGEVKLFDLKDTKNNSNVNFVINGGSIIGSTTEKTTFVTQNWPGDTVKFIPDENGDYTTFTYSDNTKLVGAFRSETEGKYLEFAPPTENGGKFLYSLTESAVILTQYGVIPAEYQDSSKWPFLLFKNGEVVLASADWTTLIDTDIKENASYHSGCILLLTRSYSTAEASGKGPSLFVYIDDMIIDLGGNVFTRADKHIFQFIGTDSTAHNTSIIVSNGTIKNASTSAPIAFNNNNSNTAADTVNLTLDGITFDLEDITGKGGVLAAFADGTEKGINSKVVLNDCIIDRGASTRNVILFSLLDNKDGMAVNKNDVEIVINGGKLVADSLSNLEFATYSPPRDGMSASADTVSLGKGSDGKEFTIVLPIGTDPADLKITLTEGNHAFIKSSEDSKNSYFVLRNLTTAYGDLPLKYLDENAYPFVVFKKGEAIYAFSDWYTFIQNDVYRNTVYQSGCTLLLRKDYTTGTDSTSNPSYFHVIKDMTIDLGGKVFARGSKHMFQLMGYAATSYNVAITIKNGTLKSGGSLAPICFNNNSNNSVADKFTVTCENVVFDVSVNTTGIVSCFKDGDKGSVNTIILNNCKIIRGSSTSSQTLFALSESAKTTGAAPENKIDVNIVINGGSFEASSFTGLTFAAFSTERVSGAGSPDKITFGKGNAGNSFTVSVPKAYSIPTSTFAFSASEYDFTKASEDSSYAYYTFTPKGGATDPDDGSDSEPEINTDVTIEGYGTVPAAYADKNVYPIVLFYNEAFVGGYNRFTEAMEIVKDLVDTPAERAVCDTAYIVLRNNVTSVNEQINLMNLLGKVVVDLQGYTLCNGSDSTKAMINSFINYSNVGSLSVAEANLSNPAEISFINGVIRNEGSYHMFGFDMTEGSVLSDLFSEYSQKKITYNFDNVKFGAVNKEIMRNWTKNGEGIAVTVNANDCTFDFTGTKSGLAMFNCTGNDIFYELSITGETKIIATALNDYKLYSTTARDKVTICGVITLTQSTDNTPNFTYDNGSDTACEFVLVSSEGGKYVYKLVSEKIPEIVVLGSISLYSNLVFNIYVPKENVSSFKINGSTTEYSNKTINGCEYYLVQIELPSDGLLANIVLSVAINTESTTVNKNWTLNVYDYAEAIIEGNFDSTTKTLMKDILVYASSAYEYFGNNEEASSVLSLVDELLGEYGAKLPSGEAKTFSDSACFTNVSVHLGSVHTFRFYLADGYSADDFEFFIGNIPVNVTIGEGYIEISTYAHKLLDDLTFTLSGDEAVGAYNIYSYYEYVKTLDNPEKTAYVEALMKYSSSAKAYRESVVD